MLLALPLIDRVYVAGAEHGLPGMLLRGFISALCLLPPTLLMGASLPAIVRWIEASPRGISRWGLLYGGNTAGAVFGCLFAGFYLLRVYSMAVATLAAAAINFLVAGGQLLAGSRRSARQAPRDLRPVLAAASAAAAPAAGPSTWPSLFPAPARWARKWSGRA